MLNDKLKLSGRVGIVVKDKNGKIKEKREETNLVVNTGLNYITSRMKDATAGVMSHMALGTGTTAAAAGDTDVETIAGSREALDSGSPTVSTNTINYVCSFEAGDVTGAITEAGIFNASSGGTMLCRVVFSALNLTSSDSISVDWTITLSAS
jgi:hypothetical protein